MIAPPAGDAPELLQTVEDFTIEQFIPQAGIKALDIEGEDAEPTEPFAHRMGDDLGAVVRPDMLGWAMFDDQRSAVASKFRHKGARQ